MLPYGFTLKLHTLDYTPDHPKVLCFYDVKLIKYKIAFFPFFSQVGSGLNMLFTQIFQVATARHNLK